MNILNQRRWWIFSMMFCLMASAESPDPTQVQIKRVTYAGPGCPSGSVSHLLAPDAKAFTLLFDSMIAEVGPNTPGGLAKNSCRVIVDLRFPQGWSYSIFSVDYRGFAALDPGVIATQKSSYWWQSQIGKLASFSSRFTGPFNDDYFRRDTLTFSDLTWSSCEKLRPLNIDTEVNVNNVQSPQSSGMITIDSMNGSVTHVYGIQWMRCS